MPSIPTPRPAECRPPSFPHPREGGVTQTRKTDRLTKGGDHFFYGLKGGENTQEGSVCEPHTQTHKTTCFVSFLFQRISGPQRSGRPYPLFLRFSSSFQEEPLRLTLGP